MVASTWPSCLVGLVKSNGAAEDYLERGPVPWKAMGLGLAELHLAQPRDVVTASDHDLRPKKASLALPTHAIWGPLPCATPGMHPGPDSGAAAVKHCCAAPLLCGPPGDVLCR